MAIRKDGQLTPKEQLFVSEYLKDFNATQAEIRARLPLCQITANCVLELLPI